MIQHSGNQANQIQFEEHEGEVNAKRSEIIPLSTYQNLSLVSGYNFYGFANPGSNPTVATFRVLRETILTGEVLYGNRTSQFMHQWSSSSLASLAFL